MGVVVQLSRAVFGGLLSCLDDVSACHIHHVAVVGNVDIAMPSQFIASCFLTWVCLVPQVEASPSLVAPL
jgi:hypothetical protein